MAQTGWRVCGKTDDGSRSECDEQGGRHSAPEIKAHHRDQLHVSHSHPARVCERDHEEHATGEAGCDQVRRQRSGTRDGKEDQPSDAAPEN